jgi:hypothetical protein
VRQALENSRYLVSLDRPPCVWYDLKFWKNWCSSTGNKEEHVKYLKIFSLAVVAAAFLMSLFAGTALADEITSPLGVTAKEEVFSLVAGTSLKVVDTSGGEILTCTKAKSTKPITGQGPGKRIVYKPTKYDFEECTFPTKMLKEGSEEGDAVGESTVETVEATSESQMTINTVLFGSCVYGATAGTSIGSIGTTSGEFSENEVTEKLTGSGFACPASTRMIAAWVLTVPNPFIFDNN